MVEEELGKGRLQIEKSLIPQGEKVVRHLAIPAKGQSPEWILNEMDTMEEQVEHKADWRQGKVSGAVYRTYTCNSLSSSILRQ